MTHRGHPHHVRTEKAVVYITPSTFVIGSGMAAFLSNPVVTVSGIGLSLSSFAAFATVHCIRFNRRRRAQHKKQEIC